MGRILINFVLNRIIPSLSPPPVKLSNKPRTNRFVQITRGHCGDGPRYKSLITAWGDRVTPPSNTGLPARRGLFDQENPIICVYTFPT